MRFEPKTLIPGILLISLALAGCPSESDDSSQPDPPVDPNGAEQEDSFYFDDPSPFTEVGTIDNPRLAVSLDGTIHLAYILSIATSHYIQYTRIENGAFRNPVKISNREGTKQGGGFLTALSSSNLITYWVNVGSTGGHLYYRSSDDGGRVFTLENRLNERSQARWPQVIKINNDILAFFFTPSGDGWDLVVNENFSDEDERSIHSAYGNPIHLQAETDGSKKIWLTYFDRVQSPMGGRLGLLTSTDGGSSYSHSYLFDDMTISSWSSFYRAARSENPDVLHLIYTEESPEITSLYYSRSEDDGENWSMPIALFNSENALTHAPMLAVSGEHVVIATADTADNGPALRYMYSDDSGKSFDSPAIATRNISSPETITGVLNQAGGLTMVWDDLASGNMEGEQLFIMKGTLR